MSPCSPHAGSGHRGPILACIALLSASGAAAQTLVDATEEARQLVVMVACDAGGERRVGSGILFSATRAGLHIATANHVVRRCRHPLSDGTVDILVRTLPDRDVRAVVLPERDTLLDLAVLRVSGREALAVDPSSIPFDRVGDPDSVPSRSNYYRDEMIAITFDRNRPWHLSRAHDIRTEPAEPRIRYEVSGLDPGRLAPDSTGRGQAGGGLFSRSERLLVGMILDDSSRHDYLSGEALRIDTLLDRMRDWGLPVDLGKATVPDSFSAVAIGASHMCGLLSGSVWCWGENDAGQLGNGTTSSRPFRVLGRNVFRSIYAADDATCGLTADGVAVCWGRDVPGLSVASPDTASLPRQVAGTRRFRTMSLGGNHACGITVEGRALCWGANDHGQLGDGSGRDSDVPAAVAGTARFDTLVAGSRHTCGLTPDGIAYCWGDNSTGALGNGSTGDATTPAPVSGGLVFRSLSASGSGHTCGISLTGAAWCWGTNESDQLGAGPGGQRSLTPSAVAGDHAFSAIQAGDEHTCGIAVDGRVYCWGSNLDGQLGRAVEGFSDVPVPLNGPEKFVRITTSFTTSGRGSLTCGITAASAVFCWGRADGTGQAGVSFGEQGESPVPLRIRPLTGR